MWHDNIEKGAPTYNFYSHIPCGMWRLYFVYFNSIKNFYSHIPCGMWLSCVSKHYDNIEISTHTSLVGCDGISAYDGSGKANFYSHIPCGMWLVKRIASGDVYNFYSHIPCGMWHEIAYFRCPKCGFLLTHPLWDVTTVSNISHLAKRISTHTSLVGCDVLTEN